MFPQCFKNKLQCKEQFEPQKAYNLRLPEPHQKLLGSYYNKTAQGDVNIFSQLTFFFNF